jgi:hypothetical protein
LQNYFPTGEKAAPEHLVLMESMMDCMVFSETTWSTFAN